MTRKARLQKQSLLERAAEPFGAAVAFRGGDEGGRTLDTQDSDLLLEGIGHGLRAIVVSQLQAARDGGREPADMTPHTVTDRLQRRAPGRARMGVKTDACGGAMIHREEPAA